MVAPGANARRRLSPLAMALLLLLLAALLALHSADPWQYVHDDNGRRYSSYARTHLALGLARTGGRDFFFNPLTGRLVPYGHHPPGLSLLLAGWFFVLGNDGPRAARALPATFHLVTALVLFGLLRRHYPGAPGLMAAFAFAVVPMSSYFGKLVNFEPVVLPLMVGALLCYWRWAEGGDGRWLAPGLVLAVLGSLIDWPMLLALAVVGADAARRWRRNEGRRFLAASLAACVSALTLAGAVTAWVSGPVGVHELATAVEFRLHLGGGYTWWQLAGKLFDYNRRYFTEPVLAASLAAACTMTWDAARGARLPPRARLLALLGVVGIVPVVGFPSSTRYHAYWQFYLLPYATLSLAYVLDRFGPRLSRGSRRLLYAGIASWLVAASAFTLSTRYATPSRYVLKRVRVFERYL